ncbi:MAG: proton-conducting membrane transporter [Defluviitaleaceae bacterium]|nr:proton-conducting membrane transporter [Defluviitaleaceae bacterium]
MLVYFVIVPIIVGLILYLLYKSTLVRIFAVIAQLGLVIASVYMFIQARAFTVYEGAIKGGFLGESGIIERIGGYESVMGITLMADTLSAVFIMLTAFFFLIGVIYSFNEQKKPLFWMLMFIWQGALMGIFLTSDFFNIFVLMEVATLIVTVLILFERAKRSMYDGLIYFMANVVIMQFYLLGAGYLYRYTGTLSLYIANEQLKFIEREYIILPYVLIMTFIVLKSALVPMFSWLPKAHGTPGAPSSVSAILSGLHIKSAVYLFLRFQYTFEVVAVPEFFLAIGIITAIVGFIMALAQSDAKLVLAYHTISQIGLIFTGFNIGGPYSYIGSLYHMVNHAIFKSTLFLATGIISYAYGTRTIYDIKGVFKSMPLVGTATLLAIFGITGTPIFNGSISKYFIMSGQQGIMQYILIFMSLGTIISFVKFSTMLWGKPNINIETKKVDIAQQIPILLLGSLCFLGGVFGQQFILFMFNTELSVNPAGYLEKIIIFFISLVVGILIYKYYIKKSKLLKRVKQIDLGFRGICIAMGIFFGIMLIYVGFLQ